MVLDGTSTEQGGIPTGSGNFGRPSVESPDMVSCPTQDVERLPLPSLSSGGSNAEGEQLRQLEVTPQLAVWPVSGRSSETAAFLQRLQTSCWPPGDQSPHKHMTPCLTSGYAAVVNAIEIPFLALQQMWLISWPICLRRATNHDH